METVWQVRCLYNMYILNHQELSICLQLFGLFFVIILDPLNFGNKVELWAMNQRIHEYYTQPELIAIFSANENVRSSLNFPSQHKCSKDTYHR